MEKSFPSCVILSVAHSRQEPWWPLLTNWTMATKEGRAWVYPTKSAASYGRETTIDLIKYSNYYYNCTYRQLLPSEEQNTCHNKHDRDSKEPPIYPSPPSSPPTDSCIIRRTLVVVRSSDEARCFSTSIVKECRASCYGPSKPTIVWV
jgi:hypothetical protein